MQLEGLRPRQTPPLLQPSFISTPSPLTHPHTPILQSNHLAQDFLNPTPTSCLRHSVLRFIPGTFAWIFPTTSLIWLLMRAR